jgi:hypothetical protein
MALAAVTVRQSEGCQGGAKLKNGRLVAKSTSPLPAPFAPSSRSAGPVGQGSFTLGSILVGVRSSQPLKGQVYSDAGRSTPQYRSRLRDRRCDSGDHRHRFDVHRIQRTDGAFRRRQLSDRGRGRRLAGPDHISLQLPGARAVLLQQFVQHRVRLLEDLRDFGGLLGGHLLAEVAGVTNQIGELA